MAKSKPIGVRFDLDMLEAMAEDKIADSPQKALNFLSSFWNERRNKINFSEKFSDLKLKKLATTPQKEVIMPDLPIYEVYLTEITSATSVESIEVTMASVKSEKALTYPEKASLERLAKQKSTQFDF